MQLPESHPNNRFVITGGPGSGKTALVTELQRLGYTGFPEIARDLISRGIVPPNGSGKPVSGRFFELIIQNRILLHQQIKGAETGFYDRGIPDSLAYFNFQKRRVPRLLTEAIGTCRYNLNVFIAPPWKEIYIQDPVRRESFEEAVTLHELTVEAYRESGYDLIGLPASNLEDRIDLIIRHIGKGR